MGFVLSCIVFNIYTTLMKIVKRVLEMSQMLELYFREIVVSLHAYLHLPIKMDLQLSICITFLHFEELHICGAKKYKMIHIVQSGSMVSHEGETKLKQLYFQ